MMIPRLVIPAAFAIGLLAVPSPASAVLIEQDYLSSGDGLITFDTESALQQLDLTMTQGPQFSVNGILAGAGGFVADGFRFATTNEVSDLFTKVGITPDIGETAENYPGTILLLELLGCTGGECSDITGGNNPRFQRLAGVNEPGAGFVYIPGSLVFANRNTAVATLRVGSVDFDFNNGNIGAYLVRPIPEPSTALLFSRGLVGIAARRGRGGNGMKRICRG